MTSANSLIRLPSQTFTHCSLVLQVLPLLIFTVLAYVQSPGDVPAAAHALALLTAPAQVLADVLGPQAPLLSSVQLPSLSHADGSKALHLALTLSLIVQVVVTSGSGVPAVLRFGPPQVNPLSTSSSSSPHQCTSSAFLMPVLQSSPSEQQLSSPLHMALPKKPLMPSLFITACMEDSTVSGHPASCRVHTFRR